MRLMFTAAILVGTSLPAHGGDYFAQCAYLFEKPRLVASSDNPFAFDIQHRDGRVALNGSFNPGFKPQSISDFIGGTFLVEAYKISRWMGLSGNSHLIVDRNSGEILFEYDPGDRSTQVFQNAGRFVVIQRDTIHVLDQGGYRSSEIPFARRLRSRGMLREGKTWLTPSGFIVSLTSRRRSRRHMFDVLDVGVTVMDLSGVVQSIFHPKVTSFVGGSDLGLQITTQKDGRDQITLISNRTGYEGQGSVYPVLFYDSQLSAPEPLSLDQSGVLTMAP